MIKCGSNLDFNIKSETERIFNLVISDVISIVEENGRYSNVELIYLVLDKYNEETVVTGGMAMLDFYGIGLVPRKTVEARYHCGLDGDMELSDAEFSNAERFLNSFNEAYLVEMILNRLRGLGYIQKKSENRFTGNMMVTGRFYKKKTFLERWFK